MGLSVSLKPLMIVTFSTLLRVLGLNFPILAEPGPAPPVPGRWFRGLWTNQMARFLMTIRWRMGTCWRVFLTRLQIAWFTHTRRVICIEHRISIFNAWKRRQHCLAVLVKLKWYLKVCKYCSCRVIISCVFETHKEEFLIMETFCYVKIECILLPSPSSILNNLIYLEYFSDDDFLFSGCFSFSFRHYHTGRSRDGSRRAASTYAIPTILDWVIPIGKASRARHWCSLVGRFVLDRRTRFLTRPTPEGNVLANPRILSHALPITTSSLQPCAPPKLIFWTETTTSFHCISYSFGIQRYFSSTNFNNFIHKHVY